MSRAFIKEADDAPVEPLPERPISLAENRVTPRGAELIHAAEAAAAMALADAPHEEERALAARDLRYWQARAASLRIVAPEPAPQTVAFGVRVTVKRAGRIAQMQI